LKPKLLFALIFFVPFSGRAQDLYFPPISGNDWETVLPESLNWCQDSIGSLCDFLGTNNTKAFILLKDGRIVLEKYFGSFDQSSNWYWASAGKTLTAFMVGMAQQQNYLSIADTSSTYLGQGWTSCSASQEKKITIRHQLTMTSGLDDGVPDHYCTLNTCMVYKADAGARWAYHNGPYTLLDGVIEAATGMTLNAYTAQNLKAPTGMTGLFVKSGHNNVFFSTARSMARFGLLILNKGNWNGNQIMTDTDYFYQMTRTSQTLNLAYGYLWWLNGTSTYMLPGSQFVFNGPVSPNAPADMIAALGKNGQFINVVPSQDIVWVRMGDAPDDSEVSFLLNDKIWQYLNVLECNPLGITDQPENTNISVFPNPASNKLSIKSEIPVTKIEFYTVQGQMIKAMEIHNKEADISLVETGTGMLFIRLHLLNGQIINRKLIRK
jgi:CubicO group peptidase (beta-lactamase class C family)